MDATMPFAYGTVLIAVTRGAPRFRILHGLADIADQGTARSVIWALGFGCVVGLFAVAA